LLKTAAKADFNKAVTQLNETSNAIAIKYIPAGTSRHIFLKEINDLILSVSRDIDIQCMSKAGGIETIQEEIRHLREQDFKLMSGRMTQYAAIKKERVNRSVNLILKQIGFIGGGSQFFGGAGICAASLGSLCAAYGAPLMAHGVNNAYENGYFLLYRKDKVGYTKKVYRLLAHKLGASEQQADTVFSAVDLGLSGYGIFRKVPSADRFRLYRTLSDDFIRDWRNMGPVPLLNESIGDTSTLFGIYQSEKER